MIDKRLLGKVSNSFRYSRNIRDKIERDDDQISRQKSRLSQKSPDCMRYDDVWLTNCRDDKQMMQMIGMSLIKMIVY